MTAFTIENLPTSIHAAQARVAVDLAVNAELYMDGTLETPRVANILNIRPGMDDEYPTWIWKPERYAVAGAIGLIGLDSLVVGDGHNAQLAYLDYGNENKKTIRTKRSVTTCTLRLSVHLSKWCTDRTAGKSTGCLGGMTK